MAYDSQIIRIKSDTSTLVNNPKDIILDGKIKVFSGNTTKIQVGVFDAGSIVDVSGFTTTTLEIKPRNADGSPPDENDASYATDTVTSFDNTLTAATWLDKSKQHIEFEISDDDMKVTPGDHWVSCYVVTSGGETIVLFAGEFEVINPGTDAGTASYVDLGTQYYTKSAADTKFLAKTGDSLSTATVAANDKVVIMDTDASDALKTVTAQDIADLAGASGLSDVVEDTTPQLGGDLDVNGNSIVSASNGDITITPNGTGDVILGNFTLDADQTVGAGQDNYVLTYDNAGGKISLEAAAGAAGGDSWGDAVDADIIPDADGTRDLGSTGTRFAETYSDALDVTNNIVVGGTVDGRDVATDGTKLDGIEAAADVTDETNVKSALDGATISSATVATGDKVLIQDVDDSDNLKYVTAQSIADLGGGGGVFTLVDSATASASSSLDLDLTGYDAYYLVVKDLLPATDSVQLWIRYSTDGGSTFKTGASDYRWTNDCNVWNFGATVRQSDNADSEIAVSGVGNQGSTAGEALTANLWLSSTSTGVIMGNYVFKKPDTAQLISTLYGQYESTGTINSIRFLFSSGNIASGSVSVFGYDLS